MPHVNAIALENVSKSFGETPLFTGLSVEFECGRTHCIMGASGGGKTTLIRLLLGLETPDSGQIIGMDGIRKSAVFQEDRLCENLSVAANLRMSRPGLKGEKKQLFLAECELLLNAMGLEGVLAKPVHELSGGMKRRVAIARAVVAQCDAIFFDEPLKGLDGTTERQVMNAIKPLLAGKTVFWVTHREEELRYFDAPLLTRIEDLRS